MTQCQNTLKITPRRKPSSRDAMSHTRDHRRSSYRAVVVAQLGQSRRVQEGTRLHPAGPDPQGQPRSLHEPVGNRLSEACLQDKFIKSGETYRTERVRCGSALDVRRLLQPQHLVGFQQGRSGPTAMQTAPSATLCGKLFANAQPHK